MRAVVERGGWWRSGFTVEADVKVYNAKEEPLTQTERIAEIARRRGRQAWIRQ